MKAGGGGEGDDGGGRDGARGALGECRRAAGRAVGDVSGGQTRCVRACVWGACGGGGLRVSADEGVGHGAGAGALVCALTLAFTQFLALTARGPAPRVVHRVAAAASAASGASASSHAASLAAMHARTVDRPAARLNAVLELVGVRGTPGAEALAAAAAYLAVLRAESDARGPDEEGAQVTANALTGLLFRAFEWLWDDPKRGEADWALARIAHAQLDVLVLSAAGDDDEDDEGDEDGGLAPAATARGAAAGWRRADEPALAEVDVGYLAAITPALTSDGVAALDRANAAVRRRLEEKAGTTDGARLRGPLEGAPVRSAIPRIRALLRAVALRVLTLPAAAMRHACLIPCVPITAMDSVECAHALVGARATLVAALGSGLRNDCSDASLAMRQRFRQAEKALERQAASMLADALDNARLEGAIAVAVTSSWRRWL